MIELWLVWGFITYWLFAFRIKQARTHYPKYLFHSEYSLETQDEIDRRCRIKTWADPLSDAALFIVAVVLWYQAVNYRSSDVVADTIALQISYYAIIWFLAKCIYLGVGYFVQRRLVTLHPELSEYRGRPREWLVAFALQIPVPACVIVGCAFGTAYGVPYGFVAAWFVQRWIAKIRRKSRTTSASIEVSPDLQMTVDHFAEMAKIPNLKLRHWQSLQPDARAGGSFTIVMSSGMLRLLSLEQQRAVIAHEVGHYIDKDAKRLYEGKENRYIPLSIVVVMGYAIYVMTGMSNSFLVPAMIFSASLGNLLVKAFDSPRFRRVEMRCDAYAAKNGYGESLVEALQVLRRASNHPSRLGWWQRKFAYHPDLETRLANIRNVMAELPVQSNEPC